MMHIARHTAIGVLLLGTIATPALAQQVDVRVKIDTKIIQDVTQEIARDLSEAMRDIAAAFGDLGITAWGNDSRQRQERYRATQTETETRRFATGTTGQLDLETLSGDITVRATAGREIVVEIIKEARAATDAAARAGMARVRVDSEERGGRVTVKTVYPNDRQSNYSVSVNYIVSAPAGTRISTRSVSGDVGVEGITGELSVNTMSGDIRISNAARLLSAKTVSGDLTLQAIKADGLLEASTMSGNIIATDVTARRLDLGTVSGSVTARNVSAGDVKLNSMSDDVVFEGTLTPRGRYEFSSHSGDVRITLDGKTGYTFEGKTFSGNVRSELPLQTGGVGSRRSSSKQVSGTFGDGSAVVNATSFSGNVIVVRR
jgi:DUF4097 and DUF4098 domain-containing protein YvlB